MLYYIACGLFGHDRCDNFEPVNSRREFAQGKGSRHSVSGNAESVDKELQILSLNLQYNLALSNTLFTNYFYYSMINE